MTKRAFSRTWGDARMGYRPRAHATGWIKGYSGTTLKTNDRIHAQCEPRPSCVWSGGFGLWPHYAGLARLQRLASPALPCLRRMRCPDLRRRCDSGRSPVIGVLAEIAASSCFDSLSLAGRGSAACLFGTNCGLMMQCSNGSLQRSEWEEQGNHKCPLLLMAKQLS